MKNPSEFRGISLVRVTGIEPAHLAAREPKSRASASSATPAYSIFAYIKLRFSISSLISAMVIPDSITAEFK